MITEQQVLSLSRHFNIDRFTILREYIQVVFLANLYNLKESEAIYFKGGTALRLLFGSFRFSEDLDFTSLLNEKDIKILLRKVVKRVHLEVSGVRINSFETKGTSITARLNYPYPGLKFPLTVHLEFSTGEKPRTKKFSPLATLYPVSPYPVVIHLSLTEILAEKVRALMIRGKPCVSTDLPTGVPSVNQNGKTGTIVPQETGCFSKSYKHLP